MRWLVVASVLAGCAPLAGLRPAGAPIEEYELGAAAVVVSPRPYVQESWRGAGQVWGGLRANDWLVLWAIVGFDHQAAVAGAAARADFLREDRAVWGAELELGWAWAAASIPFGVRLFDQTWLYTAPRLGTIGGELTFFAPIGVSVRVVEGLSVRAEAQLSWADFEGYNRRAHLAGGVAYSW